MKRRRNDAPTGPAPFIDKWGRPVWSNPFGQNRRNPELDMAPPVASWPPAPGVPAVTPTQARVQGWQERERHFDPPAEPTPVVASEPAPGPVTGEQILEQLRRARELGLAPTPAVVAPVPPPAPAPVVAPAPVAPIAAPVAPVVEQTVAQTRAERLVGQLAEQRARNQRRLRRGGSIAAACLAVFGVTAAYGFWTGGADAGSRTPPVTLLPVGAEATAGAAGSPLVPGRRANVQLRVDNPNPFAVAVVSVAGGPFPSAVDRVSGCTIANSGVTFVPPHTINAVIPSKSSALVRLVGAASMGRGAAPACHGHTFTIPVSVQVRKA